MTYDEILDYPHNFRDTDADNIREYLFRLLEALWLEDEGFSGKRPFGNSGWQYDLHEPLVRMGAIQGHIDDEDNWVEVNGVDTNEAHALVHNLIAHVFKFGESK